MRNLGTSYAIIIYIHVIYIHTYDMKYMLGLLLHICLKAAVIYRLDYILPNDIFSRSVINHSGPWGKKAMPGSPHGYDIIRYERF
jgi:hypothetical protein